MRKSQTSVGNSGVKIRSSEKDQLIAELRQQLYDLRNQERDYRGVNDEIFAMENRYRMLSDDKARAEHENRERLNRAADEISDARKQLEDLKFLLSDKTKLNLSLNDECARAKRLLEEKYFEAGRLREDAVSKGDMCADQRADKADLEREIEAVKVQRAEMYREISHLKDSNEAKTHEASSQADKLKQLDYENSRTQGRIADTQKLVDVRSHDLRAKQLALEDTENELARVREQNAKLAQSNAGLRRDNDRNTAENYDLRKEIDFQEGRNADLSIQIRDAELRLKEKEETLYMVRREVDSLRITASQGRNDNEELLAQKDALERHAAVLQSQNGDLTGELERFCQTDEILRTQLDRRGRVYGLQTKNDNEFKASMYRVNEARSRSPQKRY